MHVKPSEVVLFGRTKIYKQSPGFTCRVQILNLGRPKLLYPIRSSLLSNTRMPWPSLTSNHPQMSLISSHLIKLMVLLHVFAAGRYKYSLGSVIVDRNFKLVWSTCSAEKRLCFNMCTANRVNNLKQFQFAERFSNYNDAVQYAWLFSDDIKTLENNIK